jgi:hypothetical protein
MAEQRDRHGEAWHCYIGLASLEDRIRCEVSARLRRPGRSGRGDPEPSVR